MSLNKTHEKAPKASLLGISSILPKGSEEYCLFDSENTESETIYDDNFETEIEQVTFSLDEKYLKKVIDIEDTSETDSIFDDDSISETDSEDNDIIIEQKASKNLIRCVIVDKIEGHIKRCENSKNGKSIVEADGVLERLGVYSYHFNNDQKNLHEPGFKQLKDTSQSVLYRRRYLFCKKLYYFFTRGTGCEKHSWKIIERNVQVLLHVANNENFEYQENVLTAILPQISPFFNAKNKSTMVSQLDISNTLDKSLYSNHSAPSYFILKTVMKLNQIPIEFQEEELNELKYKEIGREMGQNLWQSYKCLKKNINNLQTPESLNDYISVFPGHERRLEKTRMKSADPSKRLLTEKNVFNLAVIDNIDFKERSFQFGNIYNVTRGTLHATLRMVFQFLLPEVIVEKPEPIRDLNIDTQIFGISQEMRDIIFKINEIFISLLAFRYNERQELEYNKIDLTAINSEILRQTEFGCNLLPPNVVILEPSGFPNDDNEILHATEMYRRDFSLEENDFLDICADEAIFRRLIKCRNKSENIRPILGVKFLDKFAAVIDYRSTRRVLELIWVAKIYLRIWYLYYEWFAIWKTHLTRIRCGNYELQKFRLAAFAPLFPVAGKSNYATSVTHFLANLEKYPLLEKKLRLCVSINLAREGHYPAFDEALETHGVAYIKQNITGNSCNQENLELQIKATQEERN
ncbi:hypothetical protein RhiirA5_418981 [Rhizophagus irregularis]|uniref:Uncharacterized protein n=1 Tax=Rhizophagus irregularis TaxID=588596 RepID=A0A2N0PJ68_9GLOM|nr:hypothetical protein RhiirA5_418981 [Rhizophagus irregularis]